MLRLYDMCSKESVSEHHMFLMSGILLQESVSEHHMFLMSGILLQETCHPESPENWRKNVSYFSSRSMKWRYVITSLTNNQSNDGL